MRISSDIERFLKALIEQAEGSVEIKRNELASQFNCVPSQINYVISTRFNTECGYVVESRRGGGGYVKITKIEVRGSNYYMHIIQSIGDALAWQSAIAILQNCKDYGPLNDKELDIILSALSDNSLILISQPDRDRLRARMLKNILLNYLKN